MCLKDDGKQRREDCGGINNFHLRQAMRGGREEDKKHEGITIRNVEMNILWSLYSNVFIFSSLLSSAKSLPLESIPSSVDSAVVGAVTIRC